MIAAFLATVEAIRAAGTPAPAPTKIEQTVARVLAGELLRDVDRDIGLDSR